MTDDDSGLFPLSAKFLYQPYRPRFDDVELMDYCPSCDMRYMCDHWPPHPYDNKIWHSCPLKNAIADRYFKKGSCNENDR